MVRSNGKYSGESAESKKKKGYCGKEKGYGTLLCKCFGYALRSKTNKKRE